MTNSLHDELLADLSNARPELAEVSNKSAYPCIVCTYEYGSGWVARYNYKNSNNDLVRITESEENDFELTPLQNAQIVALKLATLNINLNCSIIASGFDTDHYFIICG